MNPFNAAQGKGPRSAVILLRRSTNMQDASIADQRAFIQEWARKNGYTGTVEYVDDGVSGDDSRLRSGFNNLLRDLDHPDRTWSNILTYDRARFTRAYVFEAGAYADRILKAGVDVHFCSEGKSLATDNGIMWAIETSQ